MYKGYTQFHNTIIEGLRHRGIEFEGDNLQALMEVLGMTWVDAAIRPITKAGSYLCVLRNTHVVHVQGVQLDDVAGKPLVLACSAYPQMPLDQSDVRCEAGPAVDETAWYKLNGTSVVPVDPPAPMSAPDPDVFSVIAVKGPYLGCHLYRPSHVGSNLDVKVIKNMVDGMNLDNNEVVWYIQIVNPPHYTDDMLKGEPK